MKEEKFAPPDGNMGDKLPDDKKPAKMQIVMSSSSSNKVDLPRPRCESFLKDEVALALEESKPGFVESLKAFSLFLSLALQDLAAKKAMAFEKAENNDSAKVRNYIKCQCYMLQKHISRLDKFDREVTERLNKIDTFDFQRPLSPAIQTPPPPSALLKAAVEIDEVDGSSCSGKAPGSPFDFSLHDDSIDVRERSVSSASSQDSQALSLPESDVTDKTISDDVTSTDNKQRRILCQLEADMIKMKRRCKHILDVTDRYLGPLAAVQSAGGCGLAEKSSSDESAEKFEDFKAFRLTCESLGDHLKVLLKTYTNKNSARVNSV